MSFSKKFLKDKSELIKEYSYLGHNAFIKKYSKIDAFIGGNKESLDFILNIIKNKKT